MWILIKTRRRNLSKLIYQVGNAGLCPAKTFFVILYVLYPGKTKLSPQQLHEQLRASLMVFYSAAVLDVTISACRSNTWLCTNLSRNRFNAVELVVPQVSLKLLRQCVGCGL